ncbi:hypothetical protein LZY01_00020 [Levilactobacillus zymae]|uniref:Chromosome partitioning protein ParB n=1 Tax=Levilactobacillus zymae TaxID=267363 RepID=A0ABQ0WSK6_9LACO|nr:hypothetical protein [Levilactobacillus zymae]KRL15707.1 hypothetical protein FD38_GL000712 [Levilactobacillus zymae DSM 19395]QFR60632.1 hypothetical protein LZ395_03420 [Levilactobacillus zymae]GEO70834.1 hypothetical protein LZY01_00020 [Levilactobacillus zymae]
MLSLIKLAKEGKLEKTGAKPKLPIKVDGVSSETLHVYKIPLEYLYYNDKNGRIATGISQYRDELYPVNDQEDPRYNTFVAKLIERDNSTALKRTEKSIQKSGQQVYGYVLDDGRIVDGNRRFTALRNIHQTNGRTVYFEAVVLPFSYDNTTERAKIKQLELAIQMGVEERQNYDPVDLAVDIYQTTGDNDPIMTQADYAADSHMRPTEVKKYYDGAVYMKKFLGFIGAPENNFNIIKESKVWSLFYVMGKSLSKNFGDDPESQVRKNETMSSFFGVILYQIHVGVSGNTARTHVREYSSNIVNSIDNEDFNDDVADMVDDLSESLQDDEIQTTSDLMQSLTDENETIEAFGDTYDTYMRNARNSESVDKFIRNIKQSVKYYHDLNEDGGLIGSLRYNEVSEDQLKELQKYMRNLSQLSKELFSKYGDEIR